MSLTASALLQCIPVIPQAPGPPGTPQLAHGLSAGIFDALADAPPTANTDNCFSRDWLSHFGHAGAALPRVRNSNWWPHALQRYSNKGMHAV